MTAALAPRALDDDELLATLRFYRSVVVAKVSGLSAAEAVRVRLPSGPTLLGVLVHVTWVERWWFAHVLAGGPAEAAWADDDDATFVVPAGLTVDDAIAEYRRACEASDAVLAGLAPRGGLDAVGAVPDDFFGAVTARYVVWHLVKELCRHCGHLDVLRELTDGATGFA